MLHVLVVDDDADCLKILTGLIGNRGHTVHSATDGAKAAELFMEKTEIKVVLSDFAMGGPEKDGDAFFKAIQHELERRNALFIISSANISNANFKSEEVRAFFQKHNVPVYEKHRFFKEFDTIVEKHMKEKV